MSPSIALICATPHDNPGMCTVDLAAERALARQGISARLERYCYGPATVTRLERSALHYASLVGRFDEVRAADAILYWGDFLHARTYWAYALDVPVDAGARHLLLAEEPPEVLSRALSFGTSLLGDDLRFRTAADSSYGTAFRRFVQGVPRIWLRDPVSASQAQAIRGDDAGTCLGVDAALLLTGDDLRALAGSQEAASNRAVVFFGRTEGSLRQPLALARKLANGAGLDAAWLRWLPTAMPDAEELERHGLEAHEARTYEQLLAAVAGSRLVVTDAYHLCLIAWRLGVPAVCLGAGAQRAWRPLSDKKKEIFHLTQGIGPLYHFHEIVADRTRHAAIVETVLELVGDDRFVGAVAASLASQAERAEADLGATLRAMLG